MKYPYFFLNAVMLVRGQSGLCISCFEGLREYRSSVVKDCSVVEAEDLKRIEDMELLISAYWQVSPDISQATI
jgi:hypothetical protein